MPCVAILNNKKEFLTIDNHFDDIKCAPYMGLEQHWLVTPWSDCGYF